jgi:alkylated DNA nucleotide flippase Atl1
MIQRQHSVVLDERPVNVLESLARARLLEASTKHVVVEDTEVAVDDEVAYGEVVAEQGVIDSDDDGQLAEEEEEVVEEEVVEEEEVEELQLEEFAWKGKTYYKDQYNKVYRINDDTPEDEPFAEYDEKNGKLVKIA